MICMLSDGTTTQASQSASMRPPRNPVRPAVTSPACLAAFRAFSTLAELPLALMAKATSSGLAKLANCSEKIFS